jgi:hypothetical protein
MCGFCNVGVCMCGLCNVWVCVCVGLIMCGILVMCVLVFTVLCIVSFMYIYMSAQLQFTNISIYDTIISKHVAM